LDIALGQRIRLARKQMKLSQDNLGRAIGVTFQQMQKYEHGTNRVSFSRLVAISHALKTSVPDLIGTLGNAQGSGHVTKQFAKQTDLLKQPGAVDLLEAYNNLPSQKQRRSVLTLARNLKEH